MITEHLKLLLSLMNSMQLMVASLNAAEMPIFFSMRELNLKNKNLRLLILKTNY